MVDFRCAEYSDGKVVADAESRKQIKEIGIREVARATRVNRETVALIAQEKRGKPVTLARVLRSLKTPGVVQVHNVDPSRKASYHSREWLPLPK